jgi:hypothetical protein
MVGLYHFSFSLSIGFPQKLKSENHTKKIKRRHAGL